VSISLNIKQSINFTGLWCYLLLLISFSVSGQSIHTYKFRAGSAKTLQGNIYVLSIFISEPGNPWKYEEKLEVYQKQREAQKWLKAQAASYDVKIDFSEGQYGLENDIVIKNIHIGQRTISEKTDWLIEIISHPAINYVYPNALLNWIHSNSNSSNVLAIVYAKETGVGYALPYNWQMSDKYFLETCILYSNYTDGSELTSASIAHEVLHLFGAWDLYETYAQTAEREKKARELFPDAIMLRVSFNINELKLSPLTAWLVGLTEKYEPWYWWFQPSDFK